MQDTLDIIKNVENIYNSDTAFQVLKDFERVLDELDLYVYKNWEDGELLQGPDIGRHLVTCSFMWDRDNMPDPMGGKRLVDYDCKVSYKKDDIIVPRKIAKPDDMRSGTKKGKLDRKPIWVVNIEMPKSLLQDIYGGYKDTIVQPANAVDTQAQQEPQAADVEASMEPVGELE
jgi:hypothetical protein|tara:strand:+ start:2008 stop:2526 length:519 start_codon:yes stop_codon:yes gene_type:complete